MKRLIPVFCLLAGALMAGPEKFDPMEKYRSILVNQPGPVSEKVFDADGKQTGEAIYTYNRSRQLIRAEYTSAGRNDGRSEYSYGTFGLEKEVIFNSDGIAVETLKFRTDKAGNIISYQVFNAHGEESLNWEFNWQRNRIESGVRKIGKEVTERFLYRGIGGNTVQLIYNANNEETGRIVHVYKGGLLRERHMEDLTGSRKAEYEYDGSGRITLIRFYRRHGGGFVLVKRHVLEYTLVTQAKTGFDLKS